MKNLKYWILGGLLVLNIFTNITPIKSKADDGLSSTGKIVYDDPNTQGTDIILDSADHTYLKNNITANSTEILSLKEVVQQQNDFNEQLQLDLSILNAALESFQVGVDTVYNKCVSCGVTPIDKTPTDISNSIQSIYDNRYNEGFIAGQQDNYSDIEIQYTYHVHEGTEGSTANGCYTNPVHTYETYQYQCPGYNTILRTSDGNHPGSAGFYNCDAYCANYGKKGERCKAIRTGQRIVSTNYTLGCGKDENTIESATIKY